MNGHIVQLCVFELGGEQFVIDLMRVEEILRIHPHTVVPGAPVFLEGVVNLRGEIVPVVDVRKRLGLALHTDAVADARAKRRERLVLCKLGRRRVGFVVDAVSKVIRVHKDALKPAPLIASPGKAPHIIGVVGEQGQLRLMLDVLSLVGEPAS
jgi:purine-binding chemotaxis protein CheW